LEFGKLGARGPWPYRASTGCVLWLYDFWPSFGANFTASAAMSAVSLGTFFWWVGAYKLVVRAYEFLGVALIGGLWLRIPSTEAGERCLAPKVASTA